MSEAEQVEYLFSVLKKAQKALADNKDYEASKILNALIKHMEEKQND